MINCAIGSSQVYQPSSDMPWNLQRAVHLYRRINLGADVEKIQNALLRNPEDLISELITQAKNLPLSPEPEWSEWALSAYSSDEQTRNQQIVDQFLSWAYQWYADIKNNGLRDQMSWFWHNHFVTRHDDYGCPSWMYQYHKLLQKYALGNFKEFVSEMGKTPAMLIFLNGIQNTRFEPNENYARELYELFTLGLDNGYTQNDIVETARALSGWNGIDVANLCGTVEFLSALWDPGQKTIFGKTGNWGYDDVIDILFEERGIEISEYICTQLYAHFVNPDVNEDFISELAAVFRSTNFEILPVLEVLFKSEHFFDEANIGTVIPGHLEYISTFLNEFGFADSYDLNLAIIYAAGDIGQRMFNPTDVAGWESNRGWIDSSTLPFRWEVIENIMGYYYQLNGEMIPEIVNLAKALAQGRENDEVFITEQIVNFLLPKGYQHQTEYDEAVKVFKSEIPENYFEDGTWNLNWEFVPAQVFYLIRHISTSPEFQLK